MAYLKGGTVVDGNLYVEGGLRVKAVSDASGMPLPHLYDSDSSVSLRLVKFVDDEGAIKYTLFSEDVGENEVVLNVNEKSELRIHFYESNPKLSIDLSAGSLYVLKKDLTGFVKASDGTIIIDGSTYREAGQNEIPDIFCYK